MEAVLSLSHKEFLKVDHDHAKAAEAARLLYVSDRQPGISREKKGKGYSFLLAGKPIKEKKERDRIRRLAIPPSWADVWICAHGNGHIQATGLDLRRRKQYRYHAMWNSLRNETKFHRLYEFGRALPALRQKIADDLAKKELSQDKVLAAIISLMERTYIRVGNNEYEKANGSYGLTTFKNRHVAITGDKIVFSFTGKKGIHHDITRRAIDSGMVNSYIRQAAEQDFTAKDFRTCAGSLHALQAFRAIGEAATATEAKKNLLSVLDTVSAKLGNTRTVCRKYYIHPGLLQLYEENKLVKYLDELDRQEGAQKEEEDPGLTGEEKVLMKILKGSFHS